MPKFVCGRVVIVDERRARGKFEVLAFETDAVENLTPIGGWNVRSMTVDQILSKIDAIFADAERVLQAQ